jgi:hypothetical protein
MSSTRETAEQTIDKKLLPTCLDCNCFVPLPSSPTVGRSAELPDACLHSHLATFAIQATSLFFSYTMI